MNRRSALQETVDARKALLAHHVLFGPALCSPSDYVASMHMLYGIAPASTEALLRLGELHCCDGEISVSS